MAAQSRCQTGQAETMQEFTSLPLPQTLSHEPVCSALLFPGFSIVFPHISIQEEQG